MSVSSRDQPVATEMRNINEMQLTFVIVSPVNGGKSTILRHFPSISITMVATIYKLKNADQSNMSVLLLNFYSHLQRSIQ